MIDTGDPVRISREPLGQKVAYQLRRRILTGGLPVGARLVEDDLAAQLGTSRGPLREAFASLAREGLVVTLPGRGTYVKGLAADSLQRLYEVRSLLEKHAVRLAALRVREEDAVRLRGLVEQMSAASERGDTHDYVRFDAALHREIWQLSGNEHLLGLLEFLVNPCLTLVALNAESHSRWPEVVEFHRRLVEATVAGDVEKAVSVIQDLLEDSLRDARSSTQSEGDGSGEPCGP